jgi:hypothetical protein
MALSRNKLAIKNRGGLAFNPNANWELKATD